MTMSTMYGVRLIFTKDSFTRSWLRIFDPGSISMSKIDRLL